MNTDPIANGTSGIAAAAMLLVPFLCLAARAADDAPAGDDAPALRTPGSLTVLARRVGLALPFVALACVIVVLLWQRGGGGAFAWLRVPQNRIRITADWKRVSAVPVTPGVPQDANVLLVTLDTTRAGRLGCYGNTAIQTPVLDRLARRGVIFADAVTTAPTTLPAHASILTGLYPVHHGARSNGRFRVNESCVTLAEVMQARGYVTAAVVSAFVLDSRFGLARGFDRYYDNVDLDGFNQELGAAERRAATTTDKALRWLADVAEPSGRPFFLWVHYFDPHANYNPPQPFKSQYARNPYDGEIAYVDAQLGRIVEQLEAVGQADRTLIVVVGDHAESLGAHGEHTHGYLLYDVTLRVPWIMSCGDRLGGGACIEKRVSIVDIMPTVMGLLDARDAIAFDGLDLTRATPDDRTIFAETYQGFMEYGWSALLAAYLGNLKYIHGPDPELYDLAADAFEARNLNARRPKDAERLLAELGRLFGAELDANGAVTATQSLDSEELRRLQALGYAFGGAQTAGVTGPRRDPKSRIDLVNRIFEITCYYQPRGMIAKSIQLLEDLAEQYPDSFAVHFNLANAYLDDDRTTEAAGVFEECLRIQPGALTAEHGLARVHLREGSYEEAIPRLTRVVEAQPDYVGARYDLASALLAKGRLPEAATQVLRAFEIDPTRVDCLALLVRVYRQSGRARELSATLRAALDRQPTLMDVRAALADELIREHQLSAAEELMRAGVERDPNSASPRARLAWFLVSRPDETNCHPLEAKSLLHALGDLTAVVDPYALFDAAQAWERLGDPKRALALAKRARDLAIRREEHPLQAAIERFIVGTRAAVSREP